MKRTRLVLKPWVRVFLLIFLIIMISISVYNIYAGKNPKNNNTPGYNYTTDSDIAYKVYLKPNDFYEESYLPMDKQYASSLINYIDIDFKYLYTGSLNANMNYTYDITAEVVGEYENSNNGKSEVWNKKYTILSKQQQALGSRTTFDINQNIKIDYEKYNEIVNNYRKDLKLGIDAYLKVKLNINYNNTLITYGSIINNKDALEIDIPLNSSTIKITTNYDKNKTRTLSAKEVNPVNENQIRFGVIFLVVSIILSILLLPKIFISNKDYYLSELKKIMKNYSEIIVEVESEFDFKDLEILDIKTFDDMVDIEEEIKSPILYYEIEEEAESWFVIATDKYLYRYILRK